MIRINCVVDKGYFAIIEESDDKRKYTVSFYKHNLIDKSPAWTSLTEEQQSELVSARINKDINEHNKLVKAQEATKTNVETVPAETEASNMYETNDNVTKTTKKPTGNEETSIQKKTPSTQQRKNTSTQETSPANIEEIVKDREEVIDLNTTEDIPEPNIEEAVVEEVVPETTQTDVKPTDVEAQVEEPQLATSTEA